MPDQVDTDALRVALATAGDAIGNAISWAEHEGAGPDGDEREAVDALLNLAGRAADEVDRLRAEADDVYRDAYRLGQQHSGAEVHKQRAAALRTVIENAPHGFSYEGRQCELLWSGRSAKCTCWKADAL